MRNHIHPSANTVPAAADLPPDTRTSLQKKIDTGNHVSWADVCAAENSASENFAEDFHPAATLASEDTSTPRTEPDELGAKLTDGSMRVLRLAQGEDGLTDEEKTRLEEAERRAKVDRAITLSEEIQSASKPHDAEALIKRFLAGDRDFSSEEMKAMTDALDNAERITIERTPPVDFSLSTAAEKSAEIEAVRQRKIIELRPAIRMLQTRQPIDAATSARLSHINIRKILNLLMKGTKLENLPLDLVKNY